MSILYIIIGLLLLLFGRKLFWLLVAVSGFMVGFQFSEMMFPYYQQWIQLTIALGVGIVSALLSILVQRIAFVLAGFLAGLYMVLMGTHSFGFNDISSVLFIFGGVVGAVAGYVFIDWAIIVLSSMVGAGLIVGSLRLSPAMIGIVFIVMSIIGSLIQIRLMDDITDEHEH